MNSACGNPNPVAPRELAPSGATVTSLLKAFDFSTNGGKLARAVQNFISHKNLKGPFFLAQETQAPIVPIALSGTQTMMHKGSNAIVPGLARIQILPPIEPSKYETREELMAAVRSAIAEALPPEMKPMVT